MDTKETFSNPSKYTLAPFGTIHKHGKLLFIQVSRDSESATWLNLGDFFVEVLPGSIADDDFMQKCLNIYEEKNVAKNEKE